MKTIKQGLYLSVATVTALAALLIVRTNAFAVEGLQISVKCPNVILGWPSDP